MVTHKEMLEDVRQLAHGLVDVAEQHVTVAVHAVSTETQRQDPRKKKKIRRIADGKGKLPGGREEAKRCVADAPQEAALGALDERVEKLVSVVA